MTSRIGHHKSKSLWENEPHSRGKGKWGMICLFILYFVIFCHMEIYGNFLLIFLRWNIQCEMVEDI